MAVKLGIRVGSWAYITDYPHLFDRTAGDYPVEQYEAYVQLTGAPDLASYTVGAHRGSYIDYSSSWPDNSAGGARWQRDVDAGRLIVFSANGTPSNAQIDARGDDLIAFFAANPGLESIVYTHKHEPNGDLSSATWWAEYQNILTRWASRGVPRWQGTQAGVTTSPGVIYAGPNLAGLTPGDGGELGTDLLDLWYPASNSWAWSADGIHMACFDIYPGASGGGGRWRGLPELWGVSGGPATGTSEFIQWYLPRRTTQNANGLVLLAGCFEWGWDHWDKIWPGTSTRYFTDDPGGGNPSPSTWWQTNVGQYPPTFRRGLENFAEYLTANPDLFYVICYWDSIAGGSSPGSGRGPHMLDVGAPAIINQSAVAGTREEMWSAWLDFLRTPVFGHVGTPPPDPGYVADIIPIATRVRNG